MKKFQKNIKPGMSQNTRPPPPPTHTFPRFPKLQFKQAMFTCFSLQNPRYHWKGEGEVRISVCKCLKQERELLSHCSQLKWITKPLQGIKMDMLFKRHYHPPVLSKQVPRFYTIFFQLLAKNVSFLKTTDSRYRALPLLEKKSREKKTPPRLVFPVPVQGQEPGAVHVPCERCLFSTVLKGERNCTQD